MNDKMSQSDGKVRADREALAMATRYAKRAGSRVSSLYSYPRPDVSLAVAELDYELARVLWRRQIRDLRTARVLEVGCGTGGNLVRLLRWGFRPENIIGIELLRERVNAAKSILPTTVTVLQGDAIEKVRALGTFDVVMQFTVFSSILDDILRIELCKAMLSALRPGGLMTSYDFVFNNPRNSDVRRVDFASLARACGAVDIESAKLTLAPPIARKLLDWPMILSVLSGSKALATHRLVSCVKPSQI